MLSDLLKTSVKAMLMPIWRRIRHRIDIRLDPLQARLTHIEQQLAGMQSWGPARQTPVNDEARLLDITHQVHAVTAAINDLQAQWRVYVPSFVGAIASVRHLGAEVNALKQGEAGGTLFGPIGSARAPHGTGLSDERLAPGQDRLDAEVRSLREYVDTEMGARLKDVNSVLGARIQSVATQTEALSEQLLQVRRGLSTDVDDLWQVVRARPELSGAVLRQE